MMFSCIQTSLPVSRYRSLQLLGHFANNKLQNGRLETGLLLRDGNMALLQLATVRLPTINSTDKLNYSGRKHLTRLNTAIGTTPQTTPPASPTSQALMSMFVELLQLKVS